MIKDRYGCPLVDPKVMPTVKQSIMSWWLVNEMIKLGYPHNFQCERSDIRDYMFDIGALIDKAIKALAYQFESFVKSPGQEAEGIVAMQYQHLVDHGDEPSETPIRTKYLSDSVMVSPNQVQRHQVSCHDKNVIHEWIIQNRGNRDWKGRRLFFKNHAEVKPRAVSNYVDIPDTPAGQYIKITTSIDARRHEGTTVCHWVMLDDQGEECFPDSKMFDFTLIAAFIYEPRKTEDLA